MQLRGKLLCSVAAASLAVVVTSHAKWAHAQQAEVEEIFELEELVVTARKVEESLQDIPLTVSAFSARQINELGVDDINRLGDFIPGLSFEKFGGRRGAEGDTSRPVIRGQSNILGEGNAAIFVDGILFTESFLSFPFDVIERIEVVKGPQAALFGRSTFAGAINVITKRGSNEFEHVVRGRVAQHNDYEVNVSSSGPIIQDKVFYFLHGRYYDYGGEYRNELDGRRVGQEQSWGINGALEVRPIDTVSVLLRASYNEDDDGIPAQALQDRFSNNCFLDTARQYYCGAVEQFDTVRLALDRLAGEEGLRREVLRLTGTLEWDINEFILTSNTGYISSESTFGNDQTFLGDPINFGGGTFIRAEDSDRDEWSTELRLQSPITEQFRYSVGTYYYQKRRDRVRRFPGTDTVIGDFGREIVNNWAVFGAAEIDFLERWTARAELRYQEDEIANRNADGTRVGNTFKTVLPRFTLDYQWTDDTLFYGVVARGNKPGAINNDPRLPAEFLTADEEKAWSYEVGVKTTVLDNRLRFNAAAFYIDWSDQQLTQSVLVAGEPISLIANAGQTRVQGFEFDTTALVTDKWQVTFTYAMADSKFRDFCDPNQGVLTGFDCVADNGTQGGQARGNQTPNSPKHQFSFSSTYIQPVTSEIDLVFRGDYAYQSRKYAQVHNFAHTGDRDIVNLKLGLTTNYWELTFFVDNVFDDRTPSTVVRFADLGNLNIGPNADPRLDNVPGTTAVERGFLVPLADSRQFGATASYRF